MSLTRVFREPHLPYFLQIGIPSPISLTRISIENKKVLLAAEKKMADTKYPDGQDTIKQIGKKYPCLY
jgi:hypothetical protein